ncbi:MAG: MFS transporter [Acidimicrobiia bacterium]|nr:MFS transporter [Acidimicrobiia bacterium]
MSTSSAGPARGDAATTPTGPVVGSAADVPTVIDRHAWLALSLTTLVSFLVVVDVSVVNVAFPSIQADLGATESTLSWVISGYNIGVATFLLIAGRLADSRGRKKIFLPGLATFMVGSLLCGMAPNALALVAARLVQAVGGSALLPTSLAVVLPEFPPERRGMAIGIWGATGSLGAAFGPTIGSLLIEAGSWRYIFLMNVPACLIVLGLAPRLLRESSDPNASGRMDALGVPIGTVSVALMMFAIVESEHWGLFDGRTVALFVVGAALFPVLLWRSARHPESLLDLSLFRVRSFASANAAVAFYSMGFTAGFLLNSLMLQRVWGLSVRETGFTLTLSPLLSTATSIVSGRLVDRYGHRWLLGIGSMVCGLSYLLLLLTVDEQRAVLTRFIPISLLSGIGVGMTIAAWFSGSVSDIEPRRFGMANATLRTVQQVFYAVGISVVITLVSGAAETSIDGYRRGWIWVVVMYFAAATLVLVTFPPGSAASRLARSAGRS